MPCYHYNVALGLRGVVQCGGGSFCCTAVLARTKHIKTSEWTRIQSGLGPVLSPFASLRSDFMEVSICAQADDSNVNAPRADLVQPDTMVIV